LTESDIGLLLFQEALPEAPAPKKRGKSADKGE